jgi:hypothetical protein
MITQSKITNDNWMITISELTKTMYDILKILKSKKGMCDSYPQMSLFVRFEIII